jgi:hypothetical protein
VEIVDFGTGSIPNCFLGEPVITSLHEIFKPGIISTGMETFSIAGVSNQGIPAKSLLGQWGSSLQE